MTLDIRTLSYVTAIVILVTSASTWYVYGTQRRFPGSTLWTVGMNLAAMAFLLLGLRGHVPEIVSRGLGNAILVFALALQYNAVARFNGIGTGPWVVYAAAGFFSLAYALGFLVPLTESQRIVLAWMGDATVYALCAWMVWAHCRGRAARILLGATWTLTAVLAAGRGLLTALRPELGDSLVTGPVHGAAFIYANVVALLTSFGFLIILTERLQDEVEAQRQDLALRNAELSETNIHLLDALEQVRTLQGILPMCSHCKKIRNDAGYWHQVEDYIADHTDVEFTHSLCPDCLRTLYGEDVAEKVESIMAGRSSVGPGPGGDAPPEEQVVSVRNA